VAFKISLDGERRVVNVVLTGIIDVSTAPVMVTEARSVATESGFNILYDFRNAVPGDVKNTDVFWFPRNIPALTKPDAGRTRTALLHEPPARELAHFWETTFRNVGLQARAFEDEAAAYAWLAEKA